jgi:hypothetical protein
MAKPEGWRSEVNYHIRVLVAIMDGVKDRQGDAFAPGSIEQADDVPATVDFDPRIPPIGGCRIVVDGRHVYAECDVTRDVSGMYPALGIRPIRATGTVVDHAQLICVSFCRGPNADERIPPVGMPSKEMIRRYQMDVIFHTVVQRMRADAIAMSYGADDIRWAAEVAAELIRRRPASGNALTPAMDNLLAWRLGEVCLEAASSSQKVGDHIDRGLIMLRLLDRAGFEVHLKSRGGAE